MAEKTRAEIKALFETNDIPSQTNFSDFIDSISNRTDDFKEVVNAPTTDEDISSGYKKFDIVRDSVTGIFYICADNAEGNAVWVGLTRNLLTPADGYLLQSDENGQGESTGKETADLKGRIITNQVTGEWNNWFEIINVAMPGNSNSFILKGTIISRQYNKGRSNFIDFYIGCENNAGSLRKPVVEISGTNNSENFSICATTDDTSKILKVYVKNTVYQYSTAKLLFVNNLYNPSGLTVTYKNVYFGVSDPTGTQATIANTTTYAIFPDEAFTPYTPVVTARTGTISSYTASGRYKKVGRLVTGQFFTNVITNVDGTVGVVFTLPIVPFVLNTVSSGSASDSIGTGINLVDGKQLACYLTNDGGVYKGRLTYYDYTYPGATGARLTVNFIYESAT